MGSILEQNSTLVRKRIENHAFGDEQGEEYEGSKFGGFADYMRRKKIKLQNLDADIRSNSTDKPQIFRGIVAHVNGYTQPSLSDLHNLIVSHGGGFLQYLDGKTAVTHVIASHLTPKKTVEFARYRIVKPAWIVDSVNAGRLLPWDSYRVVDEGVTQKVLGFDGGKIVSQTSTQRLGYRDQTDSSWYTSQMRQQAAEYRLTSPTELEKLIHDSSEPAASIGGNSPATKAGSEVQEKYPVQDQAVDQSESDLLGSNHDLKTFGGASNPSLNDTQKQEKPQLTAEEHNAILLSNPHLAKSSTANPDFINQYYRESRLHHLSTWKADLKAQLQRRAQEKTSEKGRQKRAPGARAYVMHVDFDSFFAAVSLRKHPQLVDKPVVIAHGTGPGSEIASCNYPARRYGVKNGMWMKSALELCPELKALPYDYAAYEDASRKFYDSILAVDGTVQSISIDEALIDISDQCIKAGGSDGKGVTEGSIYREQEAAQALAKSLRSSIKEKTGCDVSIGIGNNILLAKVALRRAKPAGQHLIKPDDVLDFLGELVVTDLPGVAWSIGNKLEEVGIKYVKDIRAFSKTRLVNALGPKTGERLWDYSRGIDKQEVGDQVVRKSVSAEINWGIRFVNQQQAEEFVKSLCEELSRRLLEQLVKGRQLSMKIMRKAADAGMDPPKNLGHGKCDTFNKSVMLGVSTNDGVTIGKEAISILRSYGFPPGELRGLGVQMQKLEPLKPPGTKNTVLDSSQRRLQFKKPTAPTTPTTASPLRSSTPPSVPSALRSKDPVDHIEDVPTPEKSAVHSTVPSALDTRSTLRALGPEETPLNISGTQFIIPTQMDPTVFAELPIDIQNKLGPKQKSIRDSMTHVSSQALSDRSRSASPYPIEGDTVQPNESQLDPDILAALPDDVREEVLAQYKGSDKGVGSQQRYAHPKSPHRPRTLGFSKSISRTPTKKTKVPTIVSKGRSKRMGNDSTSTLTQSNFLSAPKKSGAREPQEDYASEDISESFLNELPPDIRAEVLAEQKRNRMKSRSGLNFENSRKKQKNAPLDTTLSRGQQKLQLSKQPEKPTFTSQKLSSLPELRDAISAWVREFSIDGEGPDKEDLNALSDYLGKVVSIERDMGKAIGVVNWLAIVIDYERFQSSELRILWESALSVLKQDVQRAIASRGLPPVVFDG
ncbi:uncharacterized protein A1O9_09559 [Exophiala aquamarina CBS 119918]|uniref:DNA repair protein REV1 n=1 Tax=Exophiala aquamarina CBS 119918 TaxID=1182545 RepID=A0A072P547_9EURO|nr:uncharacterized protein A1O9_09559 [Exophiala aquamarina CBS 119918]KEF54393.1 hypothetical protein A1O9_09559 [Exophiala aquamarina CBS 119918]